MFIGLNPSTADETEDDPTIRRCISFAKSWGYSSILMMNAYAYRATNPKDMMAADDPIGPKNDDELRDRASGCGLIIAAWGAHCEQHRAEQVHAALGYRAIMCLGVNKNGSPKHPGASGEVLKPKPMPRMNSVLLPMSSKKSKGAPVFP